MHEDLASHPVPTVMSNSSIKFYWEKVRTFRSLGCKFLFFFLFFDKLTFLETRFVENKQHTNEATEEDTLVKSVLMGNLSYSYSVRTYSGSA